MKKHLVFLVIFTCGNFAYAQDITTYNRDSTVIVTKDSGFDALVNKQREQNFLNQTMQGFRIQIYFGGIRQKAAEVKMSFISRYPDVPAYLSYQQPNFKVRVGDYKTRYEAQKYLKEFKNYFESSFIVPDDVKLPPLK